jgi:4-hydroxy-tetrahydrodipicolinate synthase
VVVTASFCANPSTAEITTHFRAIHESMETPVVAYNIPGNVARRIPVEVALELLESGVIVGLKDSPGSVDEFALLIEALGRDRTAPLMTGAHVLASRALDLGVGGLTPGLANARRRSSRSCWRHTPVVIAPRSKHISGRPAYST